MSRARSHPVVFTLAFAVALGVLLPASGTPAQVGEWLPPFSEDGAFNDAPPSTLEESARYPTAVSVAVLPDGRIAYWNGVQGSEAANISLVFQAPIPEESKSRVLDLGAYLASGADPRATASWSTPDPEDGGGGDLFCSDQRQLPDGRVIAVGGSDWSNEDEALGLPERLGRTELYGRKNARILSADGATWAQAAEMHHGRWYPTLLTLPDGRLFVASGVRRLVYNSSLAPGANPPGNLLPENVRETEVYDPATNTWTDNGDSGTSVLPLFARLHLLPNGKVLYPAAGQTWNPMGEDHQQTEFNNQKWYDPATNAWTDLGTATLGIRGGAFSVMLPLRPDAAGNYGEAKILIGGGTLGTPPGSYVSNPLTEIVTWSDDGPGGVTREMGPTLNNSRWYSSGVVLPTGEVVAVNGADRDEVVDPGAELPVRQAELYDPAQNKWIPLASGARDRTYHNTAILLADGSVLVGGHSPIPAHYGSHANHVGPPFANNFKDPSFEILRPPYLFRGERPKIQSVGGVAKLGETLDIKTPDWDDPTLEVVLSRLPAATHVTDADQRTVEVAVAGRRAPPGGSPNGTVTVNVPSSSSVLTPGNYYAFLIKDNGQGPTPSVAKIVKVKS